MPAVGTGGIYAPPRRTLSSAQPPVGNAGATSGYGVAGGPGAGTAGVIGAAVGGYGVPSSAPSTAGLGSAPSRTNPGLDYNGAATPQVNPYAPPGEISFGGSPGFAPDYLSLLENDPGYLQAMAAFKALQSQSAANRKAALQSLVLRYGFEPSDFKDQFGDISSDILSQAGKNENSEEARLQRNYDLNNQQLVRSLAARGMLQSGELGYGQNQNDIGKGEAQYDLGNQFEDQANQVIQGYLSALQGGQQNLTNSILQAESNVVSNPANYPVAPTAPTTATLDPQWATNFGEPVYLAPDGSRYRQDGTPLGF